MAIEIALVRKKAKEIRETVRTLKGFDEVDRFSENTFRELASDGWTNTDIENLKIEMSKLIFGKDMSSEEILEALSDRVSDVLGDTSPNERIKRRTEKKKYSVKKSKGKSTVECYFGGDCDECDEDDCPVKNHDKDKAHGVAVMERDDAFLLLPQFTLDIRRVKIILESVRKDYFNRLVGLHHISDGNMIVFEYDGFKDLVLCIEEDNMCKAECKKLFRELQRDLGL